MDYIKLIRVLREHLLLTQEELAKEIGVSYASINRWENEKSNPSIRNKRIIRDFAIKNHLWKDEGKNK